ncbi:hypothetical protein ACFLS8_00470 [Chloroflexota bacterium]
MRHIIFWAIVATIVISIVAIFWPFNPLPSENWDCDDNTLYLYQDFTNKGFEVQAVAGNLELSGESFEECNHVWLLVKIAGQWIAYDWNGPCSDVQHYERYNITYEQLYQTSLDDLS